MHKNNEDIVKRNEKEIFSIKFEENKNNIKQALKTYFETAYKNYNKKNPITYDKIKECTGIGKATLSDFFGGRTLPTIDSIIKLATFLNLDLSEIFNENICPKNIIDDEKSNNIDKNKKVNKDSQNIDINTKETRIKNLLYQYYDFEDEADDVIKYINYIDKSRKNN